jgi:hypothetical protein
VQLQEIDTGLRPVTDLADDTAAATAADDIPSLSSLQLWAMRFTQSVESITVLTPAEVAAANPLAAAAVAAAAAELMDVDAAVSVPVVPPAEVRPSRAARAVCADAQGQCRRAAEAPSPLPSELAADLEAGLAALDEVFYDVRAVSRVCVWLPARLTRAPADAGRVPR